MEKKFNIKLCLFILIFCSVVSTSLARYRSTYAGSSTARVAKPVLSLNTEDDFIFLSMDSISPNNEQNFYFEVSNENEKNISETSLEYVLEIITSDNLPLEFSLYEYSFSTDSYDKEVILEENKTKNYILIPKDSDNQKYMLKITWKEDEKDYKYSKTIDYIKIKADANQIN